MNRAIAFLIDMIPFMLIALPFILSVRFVILSSKKRNFNTTVLHEIFLVMTCVFFVGLFSQTLLSEFYISQNGLALVQRDESGINFIPFLTVVESCRETFGRGIASSFLINVAGNIAMFIPIGLFFPLLYQRFDFKKIALLGLSVSVLIELLQLPLNRKTDVDDLILNTAGAVIGFLLYMIVKRLATEKFMRCCRGEKPTAKGE